MPPSARNRDAPNHAVTWLLALVLALGPVGAYTHALEHLALLGRSPQGQLGKPGHGDAPSLPIDHKGCALFGAHTPFGAAAPLQGSLAPPVAPPEASQASLPAPVYRGAELLPHRQRAPPASLLLA